MSNWPAVFSIIFVVVAVAMVAGYGLISFKARRAHRGIIVTLAVTMLSVLDPPANWVTFTVFDPRFMHFPTTLHYFALAPLVEPIVNIPGYPMYFGLIGIIGSWLAARFLKARSPRQGWTAKHPLWTTFGIGLLLGIIWDVPTELFMIRARMYVYSEHWGPVIHWGSAQYPVVWGFFTWLPVATTTLLMLPNEEGRSRVLSVLSLGIGFKRNKALVSSGREMAIGVLIFACTYFLCFGIYGGLRVSGASAPTHEKWPYTETKVYDPYGHQKDLGNPGPYYR